MREAAPERLRILCLDGGEARCTSQLEILREFMHRLNIDTGSKHRPCDYFHWIGGVGAGGVVAMLLVTFTMDVDEALNVFARIYAAVFPERQYSAAERASKLEEVTKSLLQQYNMPLDARVMDESKPRVICKLGLFYMAAANLGACRLFRNYESRQASHNPTIVEAVRVVWATPGLFPPIRVGTGIVQEELVSAANGFNNPTLEVIREAHSVFGSDASISCLLSLGAGRSAIRAVGSDGNTSTKTLEQLAMDCENTADEVERRIGRLGIYFRFSVDRGLEFDSASSSIGTIAAHTTQYILENGVNNRVDNCIRSSQQDSRITLEQLCENPSKFSLLSTEKKVESDRSRTRSPATLRGLPPLSAFFVMRQEPMSVLIKNLVENKSLEQHLMVLAGLGGSGKTQLALKFARDFEEGFQLVIFVDASSPDTIKKGLLTRMRALGREYAVETVEEVLNILEHSEDDIQIRNWLIIYDNADDPDLDLRSFIPTCDHGSVLITTRNTTLKHMAPRGYLELDVMSPDEASTALLAAALPPNMEPTAPDRAASAAIVEQLGYLPVAVVQAGCYIRQQECLHEYVDLLKANRKGTLERPAKNQRDRLKYGHSVYAAFDITLDALSPGARSLLSLLSTVHFSNFPRPLIAVAAKSGFSLEFLKVLDRAADFQKTVDSLTGLFCPDGRWDEDVLAGLLEELQQYSLVTLVRSTLMVTLRLHPLVHGWAQDRMSAEEYEMYRAMAVRLLACGAELENVKLAEYLHPHIMSLSNIWDTLHVNDRLAFRQILCQDGDDDILLKLSQGVYEEVKAALGEEDIRTTRAALELADAYGNTGDEKTMEKMEMDVLRIREGLLGREDLETAEAMWRLSCTYLDEERYAEAEALDKEVLKIRTEKLGVCHKDTADAMETMAEVLAQQDRYAEAQTFQETAVETWTTLLGRAHSFTIDALVDLANLHASNDHHAEADALRQEVLTLESASLGTQHVETLRTMEWMGIAYINQKQYSEAEKLLEQAMTTMKEVHGPQHPETMDAIAWLSRVYHEQGRPAEAEALRREELAARRQVEGNRAVATLNALSWIARACMDQRKYEDMQVIAKELLEGRLETLGETHDDTLIAYDWLGRAYQELGRYPEAEEVRRKEVAIRKQVQGEQDARTITAMSWFAKALQDQGKSTEAEIIRREEIEGRKRLLQGKLDADILNSMSWVVHSLLLQEHFDEMETMARELVNGRKELLGDDHLDSLNALQWLARAYFEQHKYAEAEKPLLEIWQKRKKILGEAHLDTLNVKGWLARVAQEQGLVEEAITIRQDEIALRKQAPDSHSSLLFDAMEWLVQLYHIAQRFDEAEPLARQVLEGRTEVLGPIAPSTINSKAWLANILRGQDRLSEAASLYEQVIRERTDLWGEKNVLVALSKSKLARIYKVFGRYTEAKMLAEEAANVQRDQLKADNPALKDTLDLLEALEAPPTVDGQEHADASSDADVRSATPAVQGPAVHAAQQVPTRESGETQDLDSDIDEQGPEANDPPANLSPPQLIHRSASPFSQRNKFGRHPNAWSMFM